VLTGNLTVKTECSALQDIQIDIQRRFLAIINPAGPRAKATFMTYKAVDIEKPIPAKVPIEFFIVA